MLLRGLTWLVLSQLLGTAINVLFLSMLPGPIIGMLLLFVFLLVNGEVGEPLSVAASGLLRWMFPQHATLGATLPAGLTAGLVDVLVAAFGVGVAATAGGAAFAGVAFPSGKRMIKLLSRRRVPSVESSCAR